MRRAAPADAEPLALMRADTSLQHLLMANPGSPASDPLAEALAWIERRQSTGWFQIIDVGKGPAGFVQITDIHRKNRFGWLGLALLPVMQGRGLGRRSLAAAELAAATELGLRKLLLQVRADNAAALALYDKAGWRRVGLLSDHYDDSAVFHDVIIYEKALR